MSSWFSPSNQSCPMNSTRASRPTCNPPLSERMLDVTTILRALPYFDARTAVVVRKREEPVKLQQIVVWVSLAEIEQREFVPGTPRFPAILLEG